MSNFIDFLDVEDEQVFQKLFWPELVGVDGFEICGIPMKYSDNDILIYFFHETLSKYWEGQEIRRRREEPLGAELYGDDCLDWLNIYEAYALNAFVTYSSLTDHLDELDSWDSLYYHALAYELDGSSPVFKSLGAKATPQAWGSIQDYDADLDNCYIELVEIKPDFKSELSWGSLGLEKQSSLFEYFASELESASDSDSSSEHLFAEHFLGCMALHPGTPREILGKLQELGNEVVSATLARRSS